MSQQIIPIVSAGIAVVANQLAKRANNRQPKPEVNKTEPTEKHTITKSK